MTQPQPRKRGYECQVCDRPLRCRSEDELEKRLGEWQLHTFAHALGDIDILACPRCSLLDGQSIMLCYMDRIRSGLDLNYH